MKKQFVTYPIALKLKELGFDEECLAFFLMRNDLRIKEYKESGNKNSAFYNNTVCSAPLWQQVIDWFREKHNMFINVDISIIKFYKDDVLQPVRYQFFIEDLINRDIDFLYHSGDEDTFYTTYEEAREQAILKCIEICKNNL